MRPFRSRLVCRVLALALAGALGLTVAAPAGARSHAGTLRTALDDDQAVDAALAAVRDVPPAERLAAFAEAYARAADDGTTAEAVERLLGGTSMSGVVPAVVERAVAAAASTPALGAGLAVPSGRLAPPAGSLARAEPERLAAPRAARPDSRPRAP